MANNCFGDLAGSCSSLVLNRNPYIRLDSDGDNDGGIGVVAGVVAGVGAVPEVVRRFSQKTLEKAIRGFDKFPDSDLPGQVCHGVLKDGTRITVSLVDRDVSHVINIMADRDVSHVINIMAGIRHKNVIRLIGVCLDGPVKMLVFEFMERGSLASVMHGTAPCGLDWATRAAICAGVARGLAHIHEGINPRIVHRDIKLSNILLDRNLTPKISGFSSAEVIGDDEASKCDLVVGTIGHIDPDFLLSGHFTVKTDVYSFGVVLLEVVSGQRTFDVYRRQGQVSLVDWAWQLWESDRLLDIIHPKFVCLERDHSEVLKLIKVALLCIQVPGDRRPRMSEVELMLSGACGLIPKELQKPDYSLLKHYCSTEED